MLRRFRNISIIIGLSILLAIPLYFGTVWAVPKIGLQKQALSMNKAYQLSLEQARGWDKSAQLLTITSVDIDQPQEYDGTNGILPHWNLDFVASNNVLYHISIRDGRVVSAEEQGTAPYDESLHQTPEAIFMDSPQIAQLALNNGLQPFVGKWGRGLNFILMIVDHRPQIMVRGASQNGRPAFLSFNAQDGTLLAGAERTVSGGGLFSLQSKAKAHQNPAGEPQKLLPIQNSIPDNISALAAASTTIFAGTDARRDFFIATERAQLLVSYDSGLTWQSLTVPYNAANAILQIEITQDGSNLFVGTTDGLFYASEINKNQSIVWQIPQQGLPGGHITSLAVSPSFDIDQTIWAAVGKPTIESSLWAVPGSEGLFRSIDGGRSWEGIDLAPANIGDIALSPNYAADGTVFVSSNGMGLFKSTNNGQDWVRLPFEAIGLAQIAISPDFGVDQTLFVAAAESGLWRSKDAGASWMLLTEDMTYPTNAALQVQISPAYAMDQTVVYSAFRGGLVVSYNGGDTWQIFDLENLGGDATPRAIEFIENNNIAFSIYPIMGWEPLYERLDESGQPYSYPTPVQGRR